MVDFETKIIIQYIATWFWHLTAIIFLMGVFVFYLFGALPFVIAFIIMFAAAEFMALRRKKELGGMQGVF